MSDDQLTSKFRGMSRELLTDKSSRALESMLWGLAELDEVNDLTKHYRTIDDPST
jgi:hypothetical protein